MCEVEVIRSDRGEGDELCLISRSNTKKENSLISFSRDEGKTWSEPVHAPAALNGERHEGDYLAMAGGSLFGTSKDITVLLKGLAERVRDEEREFVTIYYGADTKEKHAQKAADLFADICPKAEVNLINGGQPVYYYMISAE